MSFLPFFPSCCSFAWSKQKGKMSKTLSLKGDNSVLNFDPCFFYRNDNFSFSWHIETASTRTVCYFTICNVRLFISTRIFFCWSFPWLFKIVFKKQMSLLHNMKHCKVCLVLVEGGDFLFYQRKLFLFILCSFNFRKWLQPVVKIISFLNKR